MNKETFLETVGDQGDLVRSLVASAHRVLVSEEIRDERDKATLNGQEKYRCRYFP